MSATFTRTSTILHLMDMHVAWVPIFNHHCKYLNVKYVYLFSQMCQIYIMWIMLNHLKLVLLKRLHVASPLVSPSLLTLQLLMPTKMSNTAWLTSHSIPNPTLVRHSVWVSILTAHNSTCVACVYYSHPSVFCAVHRSELTNGKIKSVSPMLKVLKECPNPRKYFYPVKFLEALRLDSLLPRKEVDTSLYVTNRAKLEQMYPYLPQGQKERDTVAGLVYSTLKYTVSEEAEAKAVRDKCK